LNIKNCLIENDGEKVLATSMISNVKLKFLDISKNKINGSSLIKSLETNVKLEELYLSKCNIGIEACEILQTSLIQNNRLKLIDLSFNRLNNECCQHIANGVKNNFKLKSLNVNFSI
jgi:Ran GTPase-activating protein (RanGAP) involved in mRNA processing and transport